MDRIIQLARAHPKSAFLVLLAVVTLLCFVASALITTDRERVMLVINGAKAALEEGDADTVMQLVDPDFQQEGMNRDVLRAFTAKGLDTFGPPRIAIISRNLEPGERRATCELRVVVRFPEYDEAGSPLSLGRWRVSLREVGAEWLITEVTPLEISGYQPDGLLGQRRQYIGWR